MDTEIPITRHPELPDGVPLVADFTDDRNRLSYYFPLLKETTGVRTPITKFFKVDGNYDSYPKIEYRKITEFMQSYQMRNAFVRGDYSSGKYGGEKGSKIESQDPYDIERVVIEMIRQLARGKRNLGGRIAIREWIPHDREVRYFIEGGEILYKCSLEDWDVTPPDMQAQSVAKTFDKLSWSCDFIRHKLTDEWYCIDMGLNGLYYTGSEWIAISEHIDESYSPEQFSDDMPQPEVLSR